MKNSYYCRQTNKYDLRKNFAFVTKYKRVFN